MALPPGASRTTFIEQTDPLVTTNPPVTHVDVDPVPVDQIRPAQGGAGFGGLLTVVKTSISPQQGVRYSSVSQPASADSLYSDFELTASPVYNFYVSDEEENEAGVSDRLVDPRELPRYILLRWKPAPEIFRPVDQLSTKQVRKRFDSNEKSSTSQEGVIFKIDHLFDVSRATQSTVNGFVSPGSIVANVDRPSANQLKDLAARLDEEKFLQSGPDGSSANDLQSNLNSLANSLQGVGSKSSLTNNKFTIGRPIKRGTVSIKSVHSSSPSISIEPLVSSKSKSSILQDLSTHPLATKPSTNTVRVHFHDSAIVGVVSPPKINSLSSVEVVECHSALATVLSNLEVLNVVKPVLDKNPHPPSFPAPRELEGVRYIGYVIEKYRQSPTGAFKLVDTIFINGRDEDSYVDSKVLYGATYRYRIKTVLSWIHSPDVDIPGTVPYAETVFAKPTAAAPFKCSYFDGPWGRSWSYGMVVDVDPPSPADEVVVRPQSALKQICVTWRFPDDPQRDILGFELYRRELDNEGVEVDPWKRVGPFFPPTNGGYLDRDVSFSQDNGDVMYVYAVVTVSRHQERSVFSDQIGAKINRNFMERGEVPVVFVSESGIEPGLHGRLARKPIKFENEEVSFLRSCSLTARTGTGRAAYDDVPLLLRVESLDDGETFDVPVKIVFRNVPAVVQEVNDPSSVQLGFQPDLLPKNVTVPAAQVLASADDQTAPFQKYPISTRFMPTGR